MEKDNKRKATPDIDEELMMNLMVDGVKKRGPEASARTACQSSRKRSG